MGEGLGWVLAVNLVLWTGLFLYMLRLGRQVRRAERGQALSDAHPSDRGTAAREPR